MSELKRKVAVIGIGEVPFAKLRKFADRGCCTALWNHLEKESLILDLRE